MCGPLRAALVELFGRSRVERDRREAGRFGAFRDLDVDEIRFRPAEPHLHRHRAIDGRDDRPHDRFATIDVAKTRAAALGLRDLRCRTAEIDVDDIGAAFADHAGGPRHQRGIVAPELRRNRLLDAVLVDHFHRSFGAVRECVRRDELRHGQAETERLVQRAQGTIRHARHRCEHDGRPDLVGADAKRRNEAGHSTRLYHGGQPGPGGFASRPQVVGSVAGSPSAEPAGSGTMASGRMPMPSMSRPFGVV